MKKRVLVSGGAGYIGSHVSVELINSGYDIVVADNMSNCDLTCFEGVKKITGREDIPFVKMDFCDMEAVNRLFDEYRIDAVIHFAAFKAVGESVAKPVLYYKNNLSSFLNVLEAAMGHGGCNVLFSSSATVYGEAEKLPVTEQSPRLPAIDAQRLAARARARAVVAVQRDVRRRVEAAAAAPFDGKAFRPFLQIDSLP